MARDAVGKDRLYRAHDRILPLKTAIESHLKERFTTLFDAKYDLLLYDVTSTYFEGEAAQNDRPSEVIPETNAPTANRSASAWW